MKCPVGIIVLIAAASAQGRHWVAVSTGPDRDTTGLYIDNDSLKGAFPVRSVWEKFVNSYREQKLSLVEVNCVHNTLRTLKTISLSPTGSVLQKANFPNPKSSPIVPESPQESVRRFVCVAAKGKATISSHDRRRQPT